MIHAFNQTIEYIESVLDDEIDEKKIAYLFRLFVSNEMNDIDRLIDLKKEILNTINELDDFRYKLILEMRYINSKDWDEVARNLGYDTRYTMKLHGRALKEIDEVLKEDTKRHRKTPNECGIL